MDPIQNNSNEFDSMYSQFLATTLWDQCSKRVIGADIDYSDYESDIAKLEKKIAKSPEVSLSSELLNICYFNNERLSRILSKGIMFSYDLFISYDSLARIHKVYKFQIKIDGEFRTSFVDMSTIWEYKYDKQGRISDIFASLCLCEYNHKWQKAELIHYGYFYDDKGIVRISKMFEESDGTMSELPIYDRILNEKLSKCTISRAPYIVSSNKGFKIFHRTFLKGFDVPLCPTCKNKTTYFGFVMITPEQFTLKSTSGAVPIFSCLDCLESVYYPFPKVVTDLQNLDNSVHIFKDADYLFKKCSNPDVAKESVLKIGGLPDWIQGDEHPQCPKCGDPMIFISQLKSDETVSNGKSVQMFGDSGTLYAFLHCDIVLTMMQYY